MTSKYCCDNINLKESLEKVISTSGENAVWNKDTNTVYYNPKILQGGICPCNPGFGLGNKINKQNRGINIKQSPLSLDLFRAIEESNKNGFGKPIVLPLHL
jgi:hypothetical protein